MNNFYLYIRFLLVVVTLVASQGGYGKNKNADFEKKAYEIRVDLIHNHTYDISNVKIADSIYKESEKRGSVLGKMYALQIKYYAYVANDRMKEFNETTDEYISLALENEYYDEYFDAMNAKIQSMMANEEYTKCMFAAKEMHEIAEKQNSSLGLYESNLMLGQIFKYRNNFATALQYLNRAMKAVNDNDSIPHCLIYREMAECYTDHDDDKALEYAILAKKWAPFDVYRYFCEYTYLACLYSANQLEKFKSEYDKSGLKNFTDTSVLSEEMIVNLRIMLCVAQGKYDEALELTSKLTTKVQEYSMKSDIYYHSGRYKDAYLWRIRYSSLTDSISANLQQEELSEMDAKLGNAQLRFEMQQESMYHRHILTVGALAVLLGAIAFMIYMLRRRRMQNVMLRLANEKTTLALEKAECANAVRLHFIQNMSHEIRTPLNIISGFSQILAMPGMEQDEETRTQAVSAISEHTEKLTTMLNTIIALSNYESGSIVPKVEPTTPARVVDEALSDSMLMPEGVELKRNLADAADMTISTDGKLLAEALGCLVQNALKFTSEGTVTVGASKGEREGSVTFYVEDTGCGIPVDESEKVFDRFYKIDEFVEGAGLGLSLCRTLVELLKGSVYVDTEYTGGARLVIDIPKE